MVLNDLVVSLEIVTPNDYSARHRSRTEAPANWGFATNGATMSIRHTKFWQ